MAESSESTNAGSQFNLTSIIALLTIISGVFLVSKKLASDRPFSSSESPVNPHEDQMVEARLWEDPFKWKAGEAQTNDTSPVESGTKGPTSFAIIRTQIHNRSPATNLLLLGVMIQGGTYTEDIESRIRSRFAVVSALGESGYAPESAEHVGAVLLPWPSVDDLRSGWLTNENSWFAIALDEFTTISKVHGEISTPTNSMSGGAVASTLGASTNGPPDTNQTSSVSLVPRSNDTTNVIKFPSSHVVTNALKCGDQFPLSFEWYRKRDFQPGAGTNESLPDHVLLLWLNEDRFGEHPKIKLALLFKHLAAMTQNESNSVSGLAERIALIGPRGSETLREMLPAYGSSAKELGGHVDDAARNILRKVDLYCATPGAMDQVFCKTNHGLEPRSSIASILTDTTNGWFKSFLNFSATDALLAREALEELKLRRIDLSKENENLALVSEQDTFYGRTLRLTYAAELARFQRFGTNSPRATNRNLAEDSNFLDDFVEQYRYGTNSGPFNLLSFVYLRGLDGQTATRLPEETANADARLARPASIDELKAWTPDENKAVGEAQFDYLARLGDRMKESEKDLTRRKLGRINAIGIAGSDVYDILLILQALRPRFPEAVFFTTDLDARFWNPKELPWSRNLVVMSSFGLQLTQALQGQIAPFRDSMQTAQFAATLAALGNPVLRNPPIQPRRFEIGRGGAFDLSITNEGTLHPLPPLLRGCPLLEIGLALAAFALFALFLSRVWPPLIRRTWRHWEPSIKALEFTEEDIGGEAGASALALGLAGNTCSRANDLPASILSLLNTVDEEPPKKVVAGLERNRKAMIAIMNACITTFKGYARTPASYVSAIEAARDALVAGLKMHRLCFAEWATMWVGVTILILLGAVFLAVAERPSPVGEPFTVIDGLSIWPTEILRLFAACLALIFGWKAHVSTRMGIFTIIRQYRLPLNDSPQRGSRFPPRQPQGEVLAANLWMKYQGLNQLGNRLLRTLQHFGVYFVFGFFIFALWGHIPEFPYSPARGNLAFSIDRAALIFSVVCFLLLTFWVIDGVRVCCWLIEQLSEATTDYPLACLNHFATERSVDSDSGLLTEWIDVQLIAELTDNVGRAVYYPFIVLFILLLSRNNFWDRWSWPPDLVIIFSLNSLLVVGGVVLLQKAARVKPGTLESHA